MTKVVIIGAGRGGRALLEMFMGDATVTVLGVADVNPWAPGLELARRLELPVTTDFRELVTDPRVDLIIDVTGNPEVHRTIWRLKPDRTEVMGGVSAKFMWDLVEERKRAETLQDRYALVLRELSSQADGEFIIGQNPKMREIAELIARVAPTPTPVLIRGESGTGKEQVARAIHRYSHLRDRPLITVNCTALAPALMESELFGHRRGSSTGAATDKAGLFEKADGGTIFLDEIGDVPLEVQGKLLRVLQVGEITAVGAVDPRRVRVRVIAATNRDLEAALERGELQEPLFYRLNTFTLVMPPLRERAEDIPVLAYHFLRRAEAKVNKKVERIAPEALALLKGYSWPGNLRELENLIERAVVLAVSPEIEPHHLPLHVQRPRLRLMPQEGFLVARRRLVEELERDALLGLLAEARGNITLAARQARMTRRTLHRLLKKYQLSRMDRQIETDMSH